MVGAKFVPLPIGTPASFTEISSFGGTCAPAGWPIGSAVSDQTTSRAAATRTPTRRIGSRVADEARERRRCLASRAVTGGEACQLQDHPVAGREAVRGDEVVVEIPEVLERRLPEHLVVA